VVLYSFFLTTLPPPSPGVARDLGEPFQLPRFLKAYGFLWKSIRGEEWSFFFPRCPLPGLSAFRTGSSTSSLDFVALGLYLDAVFPTSPFPRLLFQVFRRPRALCFFLCPPH